MWDSTEVKENTACFGFWRVFVVGRARNSEGKGTREGRASACSSSCLRHPCCVLGPRNTQCTVTPFALNPTLWGRYYLILRQMQTRPRRME